MNYEHSNFSVSQSNFVENSTPQLIALRSANSTTSPLIKTKQNKFPVGAIIGIVVAIVIIAFFSIAAFFLVRRRRRRRRLEAYEAQKREQEEVYDPMGKVEMDGSGKPFLGEMYGSEAKFNEIESQDRLEMDGSKGVDNKARAEMEGSKGGAEMDGSKEDSRLRAEMAGSETHAEMEGNNAGPIEMWAGDFGMSSHELATPDGEESGQPSPIGSTWDRRTRMASWGRKHKHNRSRKDSDTSGISSQNESSSARDSGSGPEPWNNRRQRPRVPGLKSPPQAASPSISQGSSRERRQRGGAALTRRLEGSSKHPPSQDVSLPSDNPISGDESEPERWNRGFGSDARSSPRDLSSPSSLSGRRHQKDSWPIRSDQQLPPPPPLLDSSRKSASSSRMAGRRNDSWGSQSAGVSTMGRSSGERIRDSSANDTSGRRAGYDSCSSRADSWATRPDHGRFRDGSPSKRTTSGAERAGFDFF